MANAVKYSITGLTQSLKKGNLYVGIGEAGKGPSNTTMYYNGVTPALNGYTVYFYNPSQPSNISYRSASNDSELVIITNSLSNQNFTTISECLVWYSTQSNYSCVNKDYENIVTDGLVLNLDAGFINSYPRSGATWSDITSNGYNGTLINGATYSSDGGGTMVFDGSNDYVQVPAITSLSSTSYTICGWWKPISSTTGFATFLGYSGGRRLLWNSGGKQMLAQMGGGVTSTINSILANMWSYVTFIYDIDLGKDYWYVNGMYNNIGNNTSSSFNSSFTIGYYGDPYYYLLNGNISMVQIYNRALSSTEILKNYQVTLPRFTGDNIVTDGLVLYLDAGYTASYPGSGTTWKDISGYGNNGTLTNGPLYSSDSGGNISFDGTNDFCINPLSTGFTQKMTVITIGKSPNSTWSNYAGLGSARVNNGYIIHNNPGSNTVTFYVINSSGSYTDIGSVTPVNIQNFNFYALTTNGTNSHKRYLNGSIVGTSTTSITRTNTGSSQNNWLGSDSGTGGRYNSIIIGAHLVYNRDLSDQEISQIYNAYKSRFGM